MRATAIGLFLVVLGCRAPLEAVRDQSSAYDPSVGSENTPRPAEVSPGRARVKVDAAQEYDARDEMVIPWPYPDWPHLKFVPLDLRLPSTGLMVPAFPPGARLVTSDEGEAAELLVTDRRCPPGFDHCLNCNQRWAEWLVPEGTTPAPGSRRIRVISRAVPVDRPVLPALGVYEWSGVETESSLDTFYEEFYAWPVDVTPGAEYILVDARGIFGTTRHLRTESWCGFMYGCWYGRRTQMRRPEGPVFAVGPLATPARSASISISGGRATEVVVDASIRLRTSRPWCVTVHSNRTSGNSCAYSRLELPDRTLERVIGQEGLEHTSAVELCRREVRAESEASREDPTPQPTISNLSM